MVQNTPSANVKPFYYDRNPTRIQIAGGAQAVAPHGSTTRATYTVPTARKALVLAMNLQIERITAAAPVLDYFITVTLAAVILDQLITRRNAVGDRATEQTAPGWPLSAAEVFTVADQDNGTGGTVSYNEMVHIVEFDP